MPIFHIDLYRLETEAEIINLGLEEIIYSQAITIIEWSEKLKSDKKSGKFESERSNDIGADFQAFLGAMELHGRLRDLRESRKQAKKEARNGAN